MINNYGTTFLGKCRTDIRHQHEYWHHWSQEDKVRYLYFLFDYFDFILTVDKIFSHIFCHLLTSVFSIINYYECMNIYHKCSLIKYACSCGYSSLPNNSFKIRCVSMEKLVRMLPFQGSSRVMMMIQSEDIWWEKTEEIWLYRMLIRKKVLNTFLFHDSKKI